MVTKWHVNGKITNRMDICNVTKRTYIVNQENMDIYIYGKNGSRMGIYTYTVGYDKKVDV